MPAENSARLLGKGHFWGKEKVKDFKDFMARAQRALWSAKSVGLEVEFIAMKKKSRLEANTMQKWSVMSNKKTLLQGLTPY